MPARFSPRCSAPCLTFAFVCGFAFVCAFAPVPMVLADGPRDNIPDQVRPVPSIGIELSDGDRAELTDGLGKLNADLDALRKRSDARVRELLPDVEIFARAIRDGLAHRELFSKRDVAGAKKVLEEGHKRAESLARGEAPWTTAKGLVVRGFRSRIDQTPQPYGLVIPDSYQGDGKADYRMDVWLHGRGERSSESVFIAGRMTSPGRFTPKDTIVLHPYGRYSNAFKVAGEIDVLEAVEHVKRGYRIDEDRVSMRGFSMGGAGCWQFAVHYADRFFAANPGAGFSETPEFLKSFQKETLQPTWYEEKLWRMYDCPGYAVNLRQLPTVAYSGELDIQKQAADVMEEALRKEGMRLLHLIGPKTKHSIHKDSMRIIEEKLDRLAARGRDVVPKEIKFATFTLKYNCMHWVEITRLGEHWKRAYLTAKIQADSNQISFAPNSNVRGIRFHFAAGLCPFAVDQPVRVVVGNHKPQTIVALRPHTDRSWECDLHFDGTAWKLGKASDEGPRKKHDLQGPIDDAFMDSFIVVRPTGRARHGAVEKWTQAELDHCIREWRHQFRGDAVVKDDKDVTKEDMAASNLILFGDPASNSVLRSVADQLPIRWTDQEVIVGKKSFAAEHHAPILVYPNPANP
ncbi:MAG: prolyl oligopeptidase family serine peptidase, partial [Planctomycetales bacterium]